MKRIISCALLFCAALPAVHAEWLTDLGAAQAQAKSEGKFVLLDFTGSDWCPWCVKLRQDVLDTSEFQSYASDHLVLMEVDFPRRKTLPAEVAAANRQLAEAYGIHSYPNVIILDKDGKKVAQYGGYSEGGAQAFIARLEQIHGWNSAPGAQANGSPHKAPEFVPVKPAAPIQYGELTLKGISGPKGRRLVLINNETLMEGEKASVKSKDKRIEVVCKEIRDDSVLITADGQPMELKLRKP